MQQSHKKLLLKISLWYLPVLIYAICFSLEIFFFSPIWALYPVVFFPGIAVLTILGEFTSVNIHSISHPAPYFSHPVASILSYFLYVYITFFLYKFIKNKS